MPGKPKEEPRDVKLTSPYGAKVTVSATRAKALLERGPQELPGGEFGQWREGHETAKAVSTDGPGSGSGNVTK